MLELYFKYRRVIARFRRGALGNEIDHIAAAISQAGYARDSAKLYLARIARFSAYATGCGCSKSAPVPAQVVDRYLKTRRTAAERLGAQGAIGHAARCVPERFAARPIPQDSDGPLLAAYLRYLRVIRGLQPKTSERFMLTPDGCSGGRRSIFRATISMISPRRTSWP